MDERIYDLLNNVEIDLDEYEEKELSSKEKQKIENRLLREVRNMKTEDRKTKEQGKDRKQQKNGAESRGNCGGSLHSRIRHSYRKQSCSGKGAFEQSL